MPPKFKKQPASGRRVKGQQREVDVEHVVVWEKAGFTAGLPAAAYAVWRFCQEVETGKVVIVMA
ncbi:MAG: hypothetical protein R3E39_01205 [Anaerolineae bacterium]